jgi:predicted nuclease with TOPRIM domain
MLREILKRLRTPMVPEANLIEMRDHLFKSEAEVERLERSAMELDGDNEQFRYDLKEVRAEREAMRLERDKAIGKFEYVDTAKKELEAKLADRDNYIRFLEGQLKQHMDDESDDDFDGPVDDDDDCDDVCDCCGLELDDCDCDDEEDDMVCIDCGCEPWNCDCPEDDE